MSNVNVKWKNYKNMDELVEAILNGDSDLKLSIEEFGMIQVLTSIEKNNMYMNIELLSGILKIGRYRIMNILNSLIEKNILNRIQDRSKGVISYKYELIL